MRHHLGIDLETRSSADIAKTGSYKYAQDPDFKILLFGCRLDDGPVEVIDLTQGDGRLPDRIVTLLQRPDVTKHAYNAQFEWYCLQRAGYDTPLEQWECTMVHGMYLGYPAGLARIGEALGLRDDEMKLSTGKALIRYFCVPNRPTRSFPGGFHRPEDDPDRWELFKRYNERDVLSETRIWQVLRQFPVPPAEWELWRADVRMNALGVRVDRDLVAGALALSDAGTERMLAEAKAITGLDNPNSQAQLLPWLQAHGCPVSDIRKETVGDLLAGADLEPDVRRVLELRQLLGKTSIKKYEAMRVTMGEGDRIRGISQFYGANRTGRYCLTGDHEVLTPDGWVRLDEWTGGKILCWESSGEKYSFQKAEALQFPYSGPMYKIEGQRIAQISTPDHKMAVLNKNGSWEPKTVEELSQKCSFTIPFTGRRVVDRPYRDDQLRVLVMTQADGYYTDDGALKFNFRKLRKVERCKRLLRRCEIPFVARSYQKSDTHCITVPWRYVPLWLREFKNKDFDYWILDENLDTVLNELPEWDGYRCGPNSIQYTTTNERNADVIQACAICNGMSATKLKKTPSNKNPKWKEAYHVNVWLAPGQGSIIRRKQVSKIDVEDINVYCAKTATGYFVVRREGKVWVTGNSGKLVQLQNLTKNHISTLDEARRLVKTGDYDLAEAIYGNVPDLLSQLVRTAFIPSEGRHFVVADFSAIEARVLAWLAGEQWVSDVFAKGRDIYCETASAMFGVPVGKHGPNAELRQRGKVATLALGYQGGPAAMIAMGALRMGIPEEDLPDIVTKWRASRPKTVRMWYELERAAVECVSTGQMTAPDCDGPAGRIIFRMEIDPIYGKRYLTMQLPVGRKLYYVDPELKENRFGKLAIHYRGTEQATGRWGTESTYAGKLAENLTQAIARDCLCEVIRRIIDRGWDVVFHVHDEVIVDAPLDVHTDDLCALMAEPIDWAPGLLLKGAGFEAAYYMKD